MESDRFNIDGHKMHYHPDRVNEWLNGNSAKVFPIYVEISPVGYCNHRCSFCALDYIGYRNRAIDKGVLMRSIENMAYCGVKSIMFAGEGEPLLHPSISEIVKFTDQVGIDVAITTNGVALTRRFCDAALRHCLWIKISCNAGEPIAYAQIHGTSEKDWYKVWDNVKYAVDLRNRTPSNKTTIGVQCVLLPENAHTLHQLAKQCRWAGVDYLVIKPYSQHLMSKTNRYADIIYHQVYDGHLHAMRMYTSSKFEIIMRRKSMEDWDGGDRGYEKCYAVPYFWAYIMASGNVYGCSAYLGNEKFCYGNIEKDTFRSIWLGSKRLEAIKFIENELDIEKCRRNCRMHKINQYLWMIKNAGEHKNFI